ncbi:MAG: cyclopropane-fatty-acyl-phospholipid synthase family protein [Beijerinckiaceae bacterium]|nr:cyclopropane-fatty-acyl-phospholipid synthase family protein [Beijerinckiaceae bacterium]
MNLMPTSLSSSLGATPVHAGNVAAISEPYPFAVRQAFKFATHLENGSLDVSMPDGATFRFQGARPGPEAQMIIHDLGFARRLAKGGEIGIAEAFLSGEWESPNLTHFLELFCVNQPVIARLLDGKPLVRFFQLVRHWLNRNTRSGSRRNIHAHYDLGNKFYGAWLDKTMTYSSALFTGANSDLAAAQTEKYRALAQQIGLAPEHHVLEIGCGWGGFAEFAGREIGCRVTGLTISQEQYDFALQRIQAAGLADRVEIKMLDYRDETGTFDRIASIEMFEAVGEEYWPTYFRQLRDRLTPTGVAGLQVITIQDALFKSYKNELDFIRRYVFPGGMLPTPTIMRDMGARYGLSLSAEHAFGLDYATTLSHWRDRFRKAWPQLMPLGFDEQFRRLWEYYLSYCEAGFRAGTIDVRQMIFAKS